MSKLKRTPLYKFHHQLGAKIIPFAGYEMPVRYTSGVIKEHLHCRQQLGFFDISHMGQFHITGESIAEQLEKLTPSNIVGLKTGQQRYTVLTNVNGGIIDDIIITRIESGFLLIVNAACKEKDYVHLKQHLPAHSQIKVLSDYALFALQGPAVESVMEQLSVPASKLIFMHACDAKIENMPCLISRCGYTGEDGFEISIETQYAEKLAKLLLNFNEVMPIGLGARDTLRLEAGLSLYGHELDETISPVEAGLKWTFRKDIQLALGAKIIQSHRLNGTARKRVGLTPEGKAMVRQNNELYDAQENKVGIVTSGGFSPSLNKPIALALIDSNYKVPILFAKVRNCSVRLNISPLPFIPHRYKRT